jgi:TDG/mug DNA glycosylase family protein
MIANRDAARCMTEALPDILAKNLSVIFCGINPARTAALAGRHFVNRSNRFWRVLHLSGFTPVQLAPEDDRSILSYGYGLTTAVARPTRRADELSHEELALAVATLERKIAAFKPRAVAFLGKAAWAAITKSPAMPWGRQAVPFAGASVWVLPNPSGLNRGFNLDALVAAYRDMRVAVIREQGDRTGRHRS